MSREKRRYVVAIRAPSGVAFPDDEIFQVKVDFPPSGDRAILRFMTRLSQPVGDALPIPHGLWVDARGTAPGIDEAMARLTAEARGFAAIISLAANGPVGELEAELAYEDTPGVNERPFFQQFLGRERILPYKRRPIPTSELYVLSRALEGHAERERLVRAIGHYHHALQNWELGSEIVALSHLYIAVEALTPVALRSLLADRGLTKEDLVEQWDIEITRLDSEVRCRLIFGGDEDIFRTVKNASDAYEHSYRRFDDVRGMAVDTRELAARHVREAILNLTDPPANTKERLLRPPYNRPFAMNTAKYVRGVLVGEGDPAPDNLPYPMLKWRTTPSSRFDAEGEKKLQFMEHIEVKKAEGFTFESVRFEVWGGPPEASERSKAKRRQD